MNDHRRSPDTSRAPVAADPARLTSVVVIVSRVVAHYEFRLGNMGAYTPVYCVAKDRYNECSVQRDSMSDQGPVGYNQV